MKKQATTVDFPGPDHSTSASEKLKPLQVDFAILTINNTEDQGVREVFGYYEKRGILSPERQKVGDRGIYAWGKVNNEAQTDEFVIVHASTGDRKGPLPAIELVRELDHLFRPKYLLIVGTAGGIKERKLGYGQVMFSRQVHVGYQNLVDSDGQQDPGEPCRPIRITLHDDPVQPPFDRLHSHAHKIADRWNKKSVYEDRRPKDLIDHAISAIDLLETKPGDDPANPWKKDLVHSLARIQGPTSGEIFSGSYLIDGRASELYRSILTTFPKVGAVEMEAGAVAQAVLYSVETDRYIGYLVIKGMSDVVDSNVPHQHRKSVRKALGPLACWVSSKFALDLIKGWEGSVNSSIGRIPLVPPKYLAAFAKELDQKRFSNSRVYSDVSIEQYSTLLETLCDASTVRSVWTLCYLAPYRFFAALDKDRHGTRVDELEMSKKVCAEYARDRGGKLEKALKEKFPHFKVFLNLARKKNISVVRVIHAGDKWLEKNRHCLKYFAAMNEERLPSGVQARISCAILDKDDFDGEDRWAKSDQVVINEELLLDYDMTAERLIVTYLDDGEEGLRPSFIRFKRHCEGKAKASGKDYREYLKAMLKPAR